MGRGIADYDHHIMISIPDYTNEQDQDFLYEDWYDDIEHNILQAMGKGAEKCNRDTWIDSNVRLIAENDTMQVGIAYEDTYIQVVCIPKYYRRYLDENSTRAEYASTTGNNYQNAKGVWMVECEMPYSIDRAAWRFLNKLAKAMGGEPVQDYSTGERIYPNISIRTSPWTSGALCVRGK